MEKPPEPPAAVLEPEPPSPIPPAAPALAVEKSPEVTQAAEPPSPPSAEPSPPAGIDEQYQQLHETVVALELNVEVAVREVLRIFAKEPLSVDEIVAPERRELGFW